MAARKKGREKRAGATDDGSGLVRVKLDTDQVRVRAEDLASMIKKLEDVEGKKSSAAEKYNGEIKLLKDRISTLADEVDTQEANVDAQTSMEFQQPAGRRKGAAAAAAAGLAGKAANDDGESAEDSAQ